MSSSGEITRPAMNSYVSARCFTIRLSKRWKVVRNLMSTFVIGINGGGTHTDFALVDSELHVHSRYQGEATNYRNVGVESMQQVLQGGIAQVLRLAGLTLD